MISLNQIKMKSEFDAAILLPVVFIIISILFNTGIVFEHAIVNQNKELHEKILYHCKIIHYQKQKNKINSSLIVILHEPANDE